MTDLIERYVAEVGRLLPKRQRADVQRELHSALLDAAEERGLQTGDTEGVTALLKEFGAPAKVAQDYGPRRFLIGPVWQPRYWLLLRWSAIIHAIVFLTRLIVSVASEVALGPAIAEVSRELIGNFLTSFAVITLIFAGLEYFGPELDLGDAVNEPDFDPLKLPPVSSERDKVALFDTVVELIVLGAFISVINLAPTWVWPAGLGEAQGVGPEFYASLVPEIVAQFTPFIPWLTAIALGSVLLKIFLLVGQRWSRLARWVDVALGVAFVIVSGLILSAAPFSSAPQLDVIVKTAVIVTLVFAVGDVVFKLYHLLKPEQPLTWQ